MKSTLSIVLPDGRTQCKVQISGTFRGQPFVYVDGPDVEGPQFIQPNADPSDWWWREGNMSCDCNRRQFLPLEMQAHLDDHKCGHEILIDKIEPLDSSLPTLFLNETTNGHAS